MSKGPQALHGDSADVNPFENRYARIAPQLRSQLVAAHVHRNHMASASSEEAIGKAACGGASVDGPSALHVDMKLIKRRGQLLSAATGESLGRGEIDGGVHRHGAGGFRSFYPRYCNLPRLDEMLSLRPAANEAP